MKCPRCQTGQLVLQTYRKQKVGHDKGVLICDRCGHREKFGA